MRSKFVFSSLVISVLMLSSLLLNVNAQSAAAATKEYKRLVALGAALKRIPPDKMNNEPHKSFVKRNEKDIVYSEPSGEWLVVSDRYWDLQKKYKTLPIAEEIAWTAASNPIPGECEGFTNCYIYYYRITDGEYLSLYPRGKYARKAIQNIIDGLGPIVKDIGPAETYSGPGEGEDRADLKAKLDELAAIVKKTKQPKTAALLAQIKKLHDAYN